MKARCYLTTLGAARCSSRCYTNDSTRLGERKSTIPALESQAEATETPFLGPPPPAPEADPSGLWYRACAVFAEPDRAIGLRGSVPASDIVAPHRCVAVLWRTRVVRRGARIRGPLGAVASPLRHSAGTSAARHRVEFVDIPGRRLRWSGARWISLRLDVVRHRQARVGGDDLYWIGPHSRHFRALFFFSA